MKQKLTLSIEPDIVRRVKKIARTRSTTVSALFEDWSSRVLLEESASAGGGVADDLLGRWGSEVDAVEPSGESDIRLEYLLKKHGS